MKNNFNIKFKQFNEYLYMRIVVLTICFVCFNLCCLWGNYTVKFEGIQDDETLLQLIQESSQLYKLQENSPSTQFGLKRRAQGDVSLIRQVLQSSAHYDAKIDFAINEDKSQVTVKIQPGPVYPLTEFSVRYLQNGEEIDAQQLQDVFSLANLPIEIGAAALPEKILQAEDFILDAFNLAGYAFASIQARDVFADQKDHNVLVLLVIETGPLTYFGKAKLQGLQRTNPDYIYKKLRWCEGDLYNPKKVEQTQEALELSGLFRSVNIAHANQPSDENLLPMQLTMVEAKQRSIGIGLNYMTALGPGVTAEWEDRNLNGYGEKLSIRGDVWQKLQEGRISYLIPDFRRPEQNLLWQIEKNHAHTKAFSEYTWAFSGTIERKINTKLRASVGLLYKLLVSERSVNNGRFDLLKVPMQVYWTNADSLLDSTKGLSAQFKCTPTLQMFNPIFAYAINQATAAYYHPLSDDNKHTLAVKCVVGSIIGANQHNIPPPERFYAGSATTLRGYRYSTVSPLGRHNKPLGGRSMFIYTVELRNRFGKNFGYVLFYELGNVYRHPWPNFKKGFLQSIGLGLSYYTPIGPLRLDIAFPLNRRRSDWHRHRYIDRTLEAYFSIGQTF